MSFQINSERGA